MSSGSPLFDVLLVTEPRFDPILDRDTFPNRLCMSRINWSWAESITLAVKTWRRVLVTRPSALLFVSVTSVNRGFDLVSTFTWAKRLGFLKNMPIIFWSHKTFSTVPTHLVGRIRESEGRYMERIIIYYRSLERLHPRIKDKFEFVPLPAHQISCMPPRKDPGDYIFAGGSAFRDFDTMFKAIRGLNLPVKIRVLGSVAKVIQDFELPDNCSLEIGDRLSDHPALYLKRIAESRFVVVPLFSTDEPKGLTTITEALYLGKPVITTDAVGLDDYIQHGVNSLRVKAGDVSGFQAAIQSLWYDRTLLETLSAGAKRSGMLLSREHFKRRIIEICEEVLVKTKSESTGDLI